MNLIGLCGYATSGKDEAQKQIGWARAAFADVIKSAVDPIFPPECSKESRRETYVAYGRAMRRYDPDYFIKRIQLPAASHIAITDCRYLNEAQWIQSQGGRLIYICRPGVGAPNEEERINYEKIAREAHRGKLKLDVVWNDSTPEELGRRILALLK